MPVSDVDREFRRPLKAGEDDGRGTVVVPVQNWREGRLGDSGIDWKVQLQKNFPVDPYLVWADLNHYVDVGGQSAIKNESDSRLPLLLELRSNKELIEDTSGQLCRDCHPVLSMLKIQSAYKIVESFEVDEVPKTRIWTASKYITAGVPIQALSMLMSSPEVVVRFQLGLPRISGYGARDFVARDGSQPSDLKFNLPQTVLGVVDDGCAFSHPNLVQDAQAPNSLKSRVRYLWDQDNQLRPKLLVQPEIDWSQQPANGQFGYGEDIALSERNISRNGSEDSKPYEDINYGPLPLLPYAAGTQLSVDSPTFGTLRSFPHGTAVLDIAAGVDPALPAMSRAEDFAAKWPLVFVQLPTRTTLDTSGGSLGVHVLDAVRYIIARAESFPYQIVAGADAIQVPFTAAISAAALSAPANEATAMSLTPPVLAARLPTTTVMPKIIEKAVAEFNVHVQVNPNSAANAPWRQRAMGPYISNHVVVNISYGALAGPHDGTSMIEMALEELVNLREGLHIVTAAGNSHRQHCHAAIDLVAGKTGSFFWNVGPDNPQASFLEIWLPRDTRPSRMNEQSHRLPVQNLASFGITVTTPEGVSVPVQIGQCRLQSNATDSEQSGPRAGVIFSQQVAQGKNGTMALLVVAPTGRDPGQHDLGRPLGSHGLWTVDVTLASAADAESGDRVLRVHAWTERNDLLYRNLRRQQSTVFSDEQPPEPTENTSSGQALESSRGEWGGRTDEPYQRAYNLGTLAGGPTDKFGARRVMTAGAYRRQDKEMSPYSSGGPSASPAANSAANSKARIRPDMDAPADESVSVRGVRSAGMRAGGTARLSGTSAAAPQAARFLANLTYMVSRESLHAKLALYWSQVVDSDEEQPVDDMRATPTPKADDRFRKAKLRLK